MLDFLKFLFKKGKKTEAHPQKKVCKNAQSCRLKEAEKNAVCDAGELKCPKIAPAEEARAEAVKEARAEEISSVKEIETASKEEPAIEAPEKNTTEEACHSESVKNETVPAESGKYLIKLSSSGIYTFLLKSPKGDTVVSSGEYTLKRSCVSGIQSVRKNGVTENIEDRTDERVEKKPNPKYEIYLAENDKYRFRLKAPNGYVILDSQAFVSKKNCLRTIENVRKYCSSEEVEEVSKQLKTKNKET